MFIGSGPPKSAKWRNDGSQIFSSKYERLFITFFYERFLISLNENFQKLWKVLYAKMSIITFMYE